MTSRNKREGRFIPGWCHNPAFKKPPRGVPMLPSHMKPKLRAGKHYDLMVIRDGQVGKMFVRVYREGAFE